MIKIVYGLIGLNILALVIFISAYFLLTSGKKVSYEEKGWTVILAIVCLILILLAAVPLRFSQSTFTLVFSTFFAALPLAIAISIWVNKKLPSFKKKETYATTYYKDKKQQAIAAAIEDNDTALLKQLIKGQDLNIQGIRVWDWDGLNYLQFAIRLRSNTTFFPIDDAANKTAIHILIENGCTTTRALAEAVKYLPQEEITLLLDAGADPNTSGFVNPNPLLFQVINDSQKQNDIAILLLQRGADVNVKHDNGFTPVMFAAFTAGTTVLWSNLWNLVFYMLETSKCDYRYKNKNGMDLQNVIKKIRSDAAAEKIVMPISFNSVVDWLTQHDIDTTPEAIKE